TFKDVAGKWVYVGGLNLPAVLLMAACTIVLVLGIKESARTNAILVGIKVGVVLFVIAVGVSYINPAHWTDVPVEDRKVTDVQELLRRRPQLAASVPVAEQVQLENGEELLQRHPEIAQVVSPEEREHIKGLKSEYLKWGMMSVLGFNRWL